MAVLKIREATIEDVPVILRFITELALYEKGEDQLKVTEEGLADALFGAKPAAYAVICCVDGEAAGFALYFYNFSTWMGKKGLYLEDLYVTPEFRGKGVGKKLIHHLAQIAVSEKCERFEWVVLDWNKPAIDFYKSIGAEPQNEWIIYRLKGQALSNFASQQVD